MNATFGMYGGPKDGENVTVPIAITGRPPRELLVPEHVPARILLTSLKARTERIIHHYNWCQATKRYVYAGPQRGAR